jgi:hypothetical protein
VKFQALLLGALLCLGVATAQAQTENQNTKKTTPSADRMKQPASESATMTGCVDEQNGHYVIRVAQTEQLLTLQAPGPDADTYFAKFVGHAVQASGTESSGTLKITNIRQIADMCGTGQ